MLLALDQGGHSSRAVVFDLEGEVVAVGQAPLGVQRHGDNRVEHDPEELMDSVHGALQQALEATSVRDSITRVALATQRSSLLAFDRATGEALSPILSWQDRRSAQWLAGIQSSGDEVRRRTGLFLSPHYGASKYRWLLDHQSGLRELESLALSPLSSFVAMRLCRERPYYVDPSNASRTLLFSRTELDWDDELLDLFGIPRAALPTCVPTHGHYGSMELAGRSLPLDVVTGDQAAALFGSGAPDNDTLYANVGTGAFIMRLEAAVSPAHDRLLESVVRTGAGAPTRVLEATVNGAAAAITEFERRNRPCINELPEWLQSEDVPLLYLNGVAGLASPWWIPDFEARFVGEGSLVQQAVAVVESIVFLMRRNIDELTRVSPVDRIRISGGVSRWDGFVQRLADLSGLPVERAEVHEATARGAAWLLTNEAAWGVDKVQRFEPRSNGHLDERYRRWLEAMPTVGD